MRDEELLDEIKDGNADAFKTLFEKYYEPLCAYLRSYTPDLDSAQEIAQTTFVKFWNKRMDIEIHTSAKSYIFRMGYHAFLKTIRQNDKHSTLLEELKQQAIEEEENRPQTDLIEATVRLRKIVDTLPPRCQQILRLKLQGFKYQEIADKLDVSIKTVESQMRIAFIKIREGFDDRLFLMILFNEISLP